MLESNYKRLFEEAYKKKSKWIWHTSSYRGALITALSEKEGIVEVFCRYTGELLYIFKTTDGGQTWCKTVVLQEG